MTDKSELSVVQAMRKERALDVIELMRHGSTKKAALEQVGIEERTFTAAIADFPEIMQDIAKLHRQRIAGLFENIIDDQEKNSKALSARAETLRMLLENDVLTKGASRELMAIDKHQQRILEVLKPIQEVSKQEPPLSEDAARANMILATMRGAQLQHVEVTVEKYRMEIGGHREAPDIVEDGTVIEESDQTEDRPDNPQDSG